jgi:hypothetical protein
LTPTSQRRGGMILLVVLAFLTLFSVVGVSFVYYADAEADAADSFRKSEVKDYPNVDRELAMSYFLGQLIYDTPNIYSALRGWSLARSLYGYNPAALNYTPYNGVGRKAVDFQASFGGMPVQNDKCVNYQQFTRAPLPTDPIQDPFINTQRSPEYYGTSSMGASYRYVGGANPPWTAYDTNSMFLALVEADGTVRSRSFDRSWNDPAALGAPFAARKYMRLRPDPLWNPGFLTPDSDPNGDVKNLEGGPGGNDSIWIDIGAPVMTAPDGRRFKMLFAPLIIDLSNRLHLWAHGNAGSNSNQGMGAPEVNRDYVLTNAAERAALDALRYGAGGLPAGSPNSNTFINPGMRPWYAPIDADGRNPGTGASSQQPFTGFTTTSASGVTPGNQTMTIAPPPPMPGGFPSSMPAVGNFIDVDFGGNQYERVQILATPTATSFTAVFTKAHPAGSRVDFNAFMPFPYYPQGYDNANNGGGPQDEITQKPLGINLFNLPGLTPQAPLPASHMEALLRFGGTNVPATSSEIFRRMPTTLANIKARNMVTLHNWHFDRVGNTPLIPWDRNAPTPPGAGPYQYTASGYPKWSSNPTPPNFGVPFAYPIGSEFTTDWRSNLGQLLRVNLNRPLTDYPAQNGIGIIDLSNAAIQAQYVKAVADRNALATDIFEALVRVVGAQKGMPQNSPEYKAARWLAQLAVNMVDYIDNDDYNTPFLWDTQGNGEWVFGTELPRLVLNEVYAQRDNNGLQKGQGKGKGNPNTEQDVNVTAELHNPLATTPPGQAYPRDGGHARLIINGSAVYHVVICQANGALSSYLRDPANNLGDLDAASAANANTVMDWPDVAPTNVVLAANGSVSDLTQTNKGFYVVGPPGGNYSPGTNPNLPTTHPSAWMSMKISNQATADGVTVLLRRLANPHLPPQPNPAQPFYNPFITVDYLENIPVADRRQDTGNGNPGNDPRPAFGRKHPYSAFNVPPPGNVAQSQVVAQTGGMGMQPSNTMFSANNPNRAPFAWLTHLDRPLINQLELLYVSGFKPHELTQQFYASNNPVAHYAPWLDQTAGIYRVLDLLGTPNNMLGAVRGGRWAGNININTLTESEIVQALCDGQNAFTAAEVAALFPKIYTSRNGNPALTPISEGKPFQSFAAGNLADTVFRPDPTAPTQSLFAVGAPTNHVYQRSSLLQKVFNNITTTSNVFAVWVTVGFFEMAPNPNDLRPEPLGAEIGRAENRHIRHRMFAILDRSAMQMYSGATGAAIAAPGTQFVSLNPSITTNRGTAGPWSAIQEYVIGDSVTSAGVAYYCIQPNRAVLPGAANTAYWLPVLQAGMLLEVDTGANMEVVVVKQTNAGTFEATFTMPHAAGVPIVCRGNPGPQTNYNPRRDQNVVLHLSVIQ